MVLLLAREAVMERFRPMLRDFGVTEQQWRVLRSLEEVGVMDLGDLADSCRLLGAEPNPYREGFGGARARTSIGRST